MNGLEVIWEGPFDWPLTKEQRARLPDFAGVYLWTVPYVHGGYIVYLAGITRRPLYRRFGEHARNHQNGIYTLFDMDEMRRGNRKEIWHGFWTKERTLAKQQEFDLRREELQHAAYVQMSTFQIFAARFDTDPRLLARLEATIMRHLYAQPKPLSAIPDRGMMLSPRRSSEQLIFVKNIALSVLHGLPSHMSI